jgi:hypothetical protein
MSCNERARIVETLAHPAWKLVLQPAVRIFVRILERWHVPRMLAALLLIVAVFGTIVGLGTAIAGPASTRFLLDFLCTKLAFAEFDREAEARDLAAPRPTHYTGEEWL